MLAQTFIYFGFKLSRKDPDCSFANFLTSWFFFTFCFHLEGGSAVQWEFNFKPAKTFFEKGPLALA